MARAERTLRFQRHRGPMHGLAVVLATWPVQLGLSAAAAAHDCAAIGRAPVTLKLAPAASAARIWALEAGDTLYFTFASGASVLGTVTLAGSAAPAPPLLAGPNGTSVSYRAKTAGAYAFRFETEGGEAAAFAVACTPVPAGKASRGPPSPAARRASRLIAEDHSRLNVGPDDALATPPTDPSIVSGHVLAPDHSRMPSETTRAASRAEIGTPKGRLQWELARNLPAAAPGAEPDDGALATNLGIKYSLQPAIMVGVLAQFDQPEGSLLGPRSLSEQNWLVGPTTSLKLAPGVSLDARAGWGALDGGLPGSAHAIDRRLVDARLANTQSLGAWRFSPSVGVNYSEETRHPGSVAAPEALVPATTKTGRVDVRPEVAYRIDLDNTMFIEPKAMIGGFWDIDNPVLQAPGTVMHQGVRLKAETGVTIGSTQGTKLQIGGGVEEGGPAAANVWNGRLQLNVPLK